MRFVNFRLRLLCLGLLLVGFSTCEETNRQFHMEYPSPLRMVSNTFQTLSRGARNFLQWSPAPFPKYSTIPSGLEPQSSYSVPHRYHTVAPVPFRSPMPTQQAFQMNYHRGSRNHSHQANTFNPQPVKDSSYIITQAEFNEMQKDQRFQAGLAGAPASHSSSSDSSPAAFSHGTHQSRPSFKEAQLPTTQQFSSMPESFIRQQHSPFSNNQYSNIPDSNSQPSPQEVPTNSPPFESGLPGAADHEESEISTKPSTLQYSYAPHEYGNGAPSTSQPYEYKPAIPAVYSEGHSPKYVTVHHHTHTKYPYKGLKSHKSHYKAHSKGHYKGHQKAKGWGGWEKPKGWGGWDSWEGWSGWDSWGWNGWGWDGWSGWSWGWSWGWKPKKQVCMKTGMFQEVKVEKPEDLPQGYRVTTISNVTLDPQVVFTPPLNTVPVSPSVLKVGEVDGMPKGFKIKRMENMVVDMSDRPGGNRNSLNMLREIHHFDNEVRNRDIQAARNAGANILSITTLTYTSPNVSAPLYGEMNKAFQEGLNNTKKQIKSGENPPILYDFFDEQITTLSNVFNDLQSVERRFFRQKLARTPKYSYQPMEVEAPIFDGEVQQWSVPEPDTGEKTILDSVYSFGQPAYRQDFANHDGFIKSWISMRELMERKRFMMDLSKFKGIEDTFDSLNDRIVRRLRFYRTISRQNFLPAEEEAQKSFMQFQFLLVPPDINVKCEGPIDPTRQGMDRVIGFGGGTTTTEGDFE